MRHIMRDVSAKCWPQSWPPVHSSTAQRLNVQPLLTCVQGSVHKRLHAAEGIIALHHTWCELVSSLREIKPLRCCWVVNIYRSEAFCYLEKSLKFKMKLQFCWLISPTVYFIYFSVDHLIVASFLNLSDHPVVGFEAIKLYITSVLKIYVRLPVGTVEF